MPTGYTHDVQTGKVTTLTEFALRCARAFGATIMQREDPLDAPLEEPKPELSYYEKSRREAEARLSELRAMTPEQVAAAAEEDHAAGVRTAEGYRQKQAEERARYESMIKQVTGWEPPTADHIGLRGFMLEQLRESISFDCTLDWPDPQPKAPAAWLADEVAACERRLTRAREAETEERERTSGRVAWIRALKASLP